MTASTSRLAYDDAYALMDAAITDPRGAVIKMTDWDAANHMRSRCHMARAIDRRENALTYERPHPLHGVSQYDRLRLTIENIDDGVFLVLARINVIPGEVRSLSSGEQLELSLPAAPVAPQIEPPRPQTDAELADAFDKIEAVEGTVVEPVNGKFRRI